jgi:predicted ATPase/signal transduction histidine kinase/DNA-binding response OmpR family regulator/tRNA A-37 threonylcarbamoyl transferase component Bud32
MKIADYETREKLSGGKRFSVYRARKETDTAPCVLKIWDKKAARSFGIGNFGITGTLQHEYRCLKQIDSEYVVKALNLIEDNEYTAIVLEDINGKSLREHLKQNRSPLKLEMFFAIAPGIAAGLAAIHKHNIIHKDLNPGNIIWDPQSHRLKIIDFNIASAFDIKVPYLGNPERLQGTLPYISPEQTGRMNRQLDHRSDFYSLGVTFYELLTGRLPFAPGNSMEIIYAHLARNPAPPHLINEKIPGLLSAIILKLLSKNPDERYQSAAGLKHDLEKAIRTNFKTFELGGRDFPGKPLIPGKLYGREKEIEQLLSAYRAVCQGTKKMILVTGYSGTGKTALVNEIHKPVTKSRGAFITGKFEQLQRNVPYFAFIQALDQFCQLLLSERQEILTQWKERILNAVGNLGKVLTDMIPQLEHVIGTQPGIPEVGGEEAKKRFNYVFQSFMQAVSGQEHPLVIFIDDLQWADLASLGLLPLLMEDRQSRYLLFIGAYRDNEVSPIHPLMTTIEEIRQREIDIPTIPIRNLGWEHVREWLGDTLKTGNKKGAGDLAALADLIYAKTQGNAFFTIRFMANLYEEKLLHFDFKNFQWNWDITEIQKQNITDNVVDLLVRKMQTLPQEVQEVLKFAACIGNVFDLDTLTVIAGKGPGEWERQLETAQEENLVYPVQSKVYKFVHDRIHLAAYRLIPGESAKPLHLEIGRLLLKNFQDPAAPVISKEEKKKIFEIVNHLNTGSELIDTGKEKLVLARLNLEAGKNAKMSAAYKLGADYVQTAIRLLPGDCWPQHYDLTLAVYQEAVQTAYLCGNFAEMENFVGIVLAHAREVSHQTVAYECRIMGLTVQSQEGRATETLLSIFASLGIDIPRTPDPAQIAGVLGKTQAMLERKGLESLKDLEPVSEPKIRLVMRLFNIGTAAIIFGAQELLPVVAAKMMDLILEYGLTQETPSVIAIYGTIRAFLNDIPGAYRLGEIALDLLDKGIGNEAIKVRAMVAICLYLAGNKLHFKKTCKLLIDTYPVALDVGDSEYAGYILVNYIVFLTRTGMELTKWKEEVQGIQEKIIQLKQSILLGALSMEQSVNANLLGENPQPAVLKTGLDDILETMDPGSKLLFKCHINIKRTILAYLFEEYDNILEYIGILEESWKFLATPLTYLRSDFYFYVPLAYLQLYTRADAAAAKNVYLGKAKDSINAMEEWAKFGPVNFLHKYYLLQAEWSRVTGTDHEAAEYYDKAVEKALENEFINEAALANELAAKFYVQRHRHKLATLYFMEALACYRRWGAKAKVKDLEEKYPKYLSMDIAGTKPGPGATSSTTDTTSELLDVRSIIKASQALSSQVRLKPLLEQMMPLLIKNAGAQKSMLIENIDNRLLIQAEGTAHGVTGILQRQPLEESGKLPLSMVNYVARSKQKLVFANVSKNPNYASDPYIRKHRVKSAAGFPILIKDKLSAIIYLENNLVEGAFTPGRLNVINTLSSQIAISMENARVYRDLAELNQSLEQKVAARTEELEEMGRAKSRFFANISHEFRTPLTLIMGTLEQILDGTPGEVLKSQSHLMLRNSQRLLNLINQLLDLSKLDSGKMKLLAREQDIVSFVESMVMCFEPLAKKERINLVFRSGEKKIAAYFDPDKVEKAILNLLSNAFKYTSSGGSIEVLVHQAGTRRKFPAGCVEIVVQDTGEGIPAQQLPHIFERFFRAGGSHEHKRQGSGIGLALVNELVTLHHGEIRVKSREGKGTTFTLRLALGSSHLKPEEIGEESGKRTVYGDIDAKQVAAGFAGDPGYEDSTETGKGKKGKHVILVVEDNADVRRFIRGPLETLYRVEEAVNGKDGIEKAKEIVPDLVVSDVMMPEADGYELCRVLKTEVATSHIPIILLTARASDESVIEGLETGADDYITKPFNIKILLARIKNLIDLRRGLQEKIQREMVLQPTAIAVSSVDQQFMQELKEALETHLPDPEFSVEQLAKILYMGRTTLNLKIKALTGESTNRFIQSYRLKRAAQLLKANFGNVTEVAFEVGFSNSAYFSKCFKEKFHRPPHAFQAAEAH